MCARGAVSIVWGLPEYLFGLRVIGMFRKGRGRGQRRQYIFGRDWTLTLGVKQMLFSLNGGNMPAFSVIQAKLSGGRDYLYHAESKCPSPSWVFREEDSPLLMPCVFTEEVGHSTMETAAVGTLPLHNTLSVMCSNYSKAPGKLLFHSVNAHGHDI